MKEEVKLTAVLVQGSAALIIGSLTSLTGFAFAWPSYTFQIYQSNATVLEAPITTAQVSILGSIINVGALIATPFCGYAVDKIGRKYSAMLFGLPYVLSWTLISMATSFYVVLFAVGLAGFGASGQAVSSVYIAEISQDSIRGALTSSTVYGFLIGLLSSYIFGGYMSYYNVLYLHMALSTLYILLLTLLKESPCYLLKCGKEKEAAESIAFYRRVDVKSKEIEIEIKKIKLQLDTNIVKILENRNAERNLIRFGITTFALTVSAINLILTGSKESQASEELLEKNSTNPVEKKDTIWQFLKRSESSQRALATVLMSMAVTVLMGSIVLQIYAEALFKEAIPTMHPNTCSILLATDFLIGSLVSASLLDKFGRKTLLTVTSILSGIFTILIGTQLHLHWAPHWFTAFAIYGFSFVYNLGASIVPFVLTAEVFLPEVRGLGCSLTMATMWIMNWVTLIVFNPLVEACGLGPTFYVFSVICFLGAAFSHFCLPETKGLSADQIQLLFIKNKKHNIQKM